jgi:hypothetical protein
MNSCRPMTLLIIGLPLPIKALVARRWPTMKDVHVHCMHTQAMHSAYHVLVILLQIISSSIFFCTHLHERSRPTCALLDLALVSTSVSQLVGVHQDRWSARISKNFTGSPCYQLRGVVTVSKLSKSSVSLMFFAISYRTRNRIFNLCGLNIGCSGT